LNGSSSHKRFAVHELALRCLVWAFSVVVLFNLSILLSGCRDSGIFRLRGDFRHLRQAEFYIYSTDGGMDRVDTIHVSDGEFDWQIPLDREATFFVIFPNLSEQVVFGAPGEVVTMEGDAEQLRATRVEGTDDNEALTRFRLEHADDTPAQINAAMEAFIHENPASRLSPHFQSLLTQRKNGLSRLSAGQRVPNITLPPDGLGASTDTVFIKGGQPTLWIFWANWKRDSQDAFLHIRRKLRDNENADKAHRLRPVSISLDTEPEKYFFTCRYDSVTWTSRCYRLSWDTPVVKQLGISEIPFFVLTDTLQKVVALGRDWEKDIAPHIDKLLHE